MGRDLALRSDRDLLAASRERGVGFGEFYRRHREAVLAFHGKRVREPELAADLTAETFAAALLAVHDRSRGLPEQPAAACCPARGRDHTRSTGSRSQPLPIQPVPSSWLRPERKTAAAGRPRPTGRALFRGGL